MSLDGMTNADYANLTGKIHMLVIDKTLTIGGAAADAKAVGDALADIGFVGEMIPIEEKGVAGGVATLDASAKVPASQLPSMDYIPTSQKGVAGGVASLGSNSKIPAAQIPDAASIGAAPATHNHAHGELTASNLTTWAKSATVGGSFSVNPSKTTSGVPATGVYLFGELLVQPNGQRELLVYGDNNGKMWMNTCDGSVWLGWVDVFTELNPPTAKQVTGAARIETTEYTGTGVYGSSNKNQILLTGTPKMIVVVKQYNGVSMALKSSGVGAWRDACWYGGFIWFYGGAEDIFVTDMYADSAPSVSVELTNDYFKWYSSDNEEVQQNESGAKYYAHVFY